MVLRTTPHPGGNMSVWKRACKDILRYLNTACSEKRLCCTLWVSTSTFVSFLFLRRCMALGVFGGLCCENWKGYIFQSLSTINWTILRLCSTENTNFCIVTCAVIIISHLVEAQSEASPPLRKRWFVCDASSSTNSYPSTNIKPTEPNQITIR